jgi:hypothetical protein
MGVQACGAPLYLMYEYRALPKPPTRIFPIRPLLPAFSGTAQRHRKERHLVSVTAAAVFPCRGQRCRARMNSTPDCLQVTAGSLWVWWHHLTTQPRSPMQPYLVNIPCSTLQPAPCFKRGASRLTGYGAGHFTHSCLHLPSTMLPDRPLTCSRIRHPISPVPYNLPQFHG